MTQPYVRLEVKGMNRLFKKMKATTSSVGIILGFRNAGKHISGWIKENRLEGPRPKYLGIKSGRLHSSIHGGHVYKRGNKYVMPIGTNVKGKKGFNYPAYWEGVGKFAGSRRVPPRPFLRPGIENKGNQKEAVRLILWSIKNAQRMA